jgi:hypothetical protein
LRLGFAGALLLMLVGSPLSGCSDDCAFDDGDVAGRAENPDGVAYPTDDWGFGARDGNTPGQRLPNFTFQGYRDSVRTGGIQPVSMADFYDPTGARQRVLLVMVGVMWCPHCAAETAEMAALAPTLRAEGAEMVQVLIEGPDPGEGPDRCNLDDWVADKETTFTVVLDVGARRIAPYAAIDGVPWNAIVDARTMEVLDAATGAPVDLAASVRGALEWVDAHPL